MKNLYKVNVEINDRGHLERILTPIGFASVSSYAKFYVARLTTEDMTLITLSIPSAVFIPLEQDGLGVHIKPLVGHLYT